MATEKKLKEKIALACKLTDKDQITRINELHQTLFKKVDKTVENGPVSLKMGNSAGTKEMVKLVMELDKLQAVK